ncbi:MAG: SDR family oxidoreductase [SAR324 cluster bacterium]|nr:SDR family oxidoreductase [SAR324 cluster bacterium]
MRGLKDKVAIVTGGGGGIGTAICTRLAEEGCIVGVFDIDAEKAAATTDQIAKAGGRAHTQVVDITRYDEVAHAVQDFERSCGPTNILINNAGWDRLVNFLDTDPDFWEQVISINLRGALNLHHVVLPGMVERRAGRVVNISSDAGRVGSSGEAVYAACKGGMIAFTKTVARELARTGITLNVVCPGPTDTPLFAAVAGDSEVGQKIREGLKRAIPFKRLGRPEDLPGIIALLSSDDAAFITGQVISVSGGLTMHG